MANKQLVDVSEAKTFIEANWPNDPLLRHIALNLLDKLPRVEATEVVHAKWEEWWPGDCALIMTGEEMLYQCSACTAKYSDIEGKRYCPNCGAFMDE